MKKLNYLLFPVFLAFSGVAAAGGFSGSVNLDDAKVDIRLGSGGNDSPQRTSGASNANVPPGHMPPPGQCRIWYKGRKPGQQPPPGNCKKFRGKVPRGAVLIRN